MILAQLAGRRNINLARNLSSPAEITRPLLSGLVLPGAELEDRLRSKAYASEEG